MHLGTLCLPRSEWRKLAALLESRLAGQISMFEEEYPVVADAADKAFEHYKFVQARTKERITKKDKREIIPVDLQSITTGYSRSLGPELVANTFWEHLDFDQILKSGGFDQKQISLAKAVIIGRLIAPASELRTRQWLSQGTALAEMLPVDLTNAGKDAFYEIADLLYTKNGPSVHSRKIVF